MSNTRTTFLAQYYPLYFIALIGLLLTSNNAINQYIFLLINHWSNDNLPRLLILHTTELGNGTIAIGISLLVLNRLPKYSKQVLVTTILLGITIHYLKGYFDSPRPTLVLPQGDFFALDLIVTTSSFPSGHTATAFALLTLFWLNTNRSSLLKNSLLVIAILVGLSRIAIGAHWPIDVVFGAFFGWLVAFIVCLILPVKNTINSNSHNKSDKFIIILFCLLVVAHEFIMFFEPKEFTSADTIYWARYLMALMLIFVVGWQLFGNRSR